MGTICCHNLHRPQRVKLEDYDILPRRSRPALPLERLLRIDLLSDSFIGASYSQSRFPGFKGVWEFRNKRLLLFTPNVVLVMGIPDPATSLYELHAVYRSEEEEKVIFAGFVDDHSSKHVAILARSAAGSLRVKTCRIRKNKLRPRVEPAMLLVREESNPAQNGSFANEQGFRYVSKVDPLRAGNGDYPCVVEKAEEQQLEIKDVVYTKLIRNTEDTKSQLLILSASTFLRVTLDRDKIIHTASTHIDKPALAVDFRAGRYFLLCESNPNRNLLVLLDADSLHDSQRLDLRLTGRLGDFSFRFVQCPYLHWSDRPADSLPGSKYIILAGTVKTSTTERKSCVVRYNIVKQDYARIALIDSEAEIACLDYGPYDNGPIIVGLTDGTMMGFDFGSLSKVLGIRATSGPTAAIAFEPCRGFAICGQIAVATVSVTRDRYLYRYFEEERAGPEGRVQVQRKL